MLERAIHVDEPFDLSLTLSALGHGAYDPTVRFEGGDVWRATRTPDGPGTQRITRAADGSVLVQAWGPGASWLVDHAPALLGVDDDPDAFEVHHAILRDIHRRSRGMRMTRTHAIVEALVPVIIEQKVPTAEAFPAWRKLARRFGEPAPGPKRLMLPPDPARLASLPYWAFHPLGIERRRADVIRRVCANARRLDEGASLPRADAYRRMRALPGIGQWTAAEVGRVALGDPDAVSVGDYHLKNQVCWALAGEPRGTDERMLELLEPYRGQRARAARLIEMTGMGAPRYGPRVRLRSFARY